MTRRFLIAAVLTTFLATPCFADDSRYKVVTIPNIPEEPFVVPVVLLDGKTGETWVLRRYTSPYPSIKWEPIELGKQNEKEIFKPAASSK